MNSQHAEDPHDGLDSSDLDTEDGAASGDKHSPIHEVFNPDNSVGVACNREGEIVGLHIDDNGRDNGDVWLAQEILKLAGLANLKSRLGLRFEMETNGVLPHTIDAFNLPTEAAYRAAEQAAFSTQISN